MDVHTNFDCIALIPERAERAGDFIGSLLQAFLRTGYYLTDHPEARKAKAGLHSHFVALVGAQGELTLMIGEELGKQVLFIEGLAEKPLRISDMMPRGVAETYTANSMKFFNRKEIVSLSLSSRMNEEEFSRFIDIMSEATSSAGMTMTSLRENFLQTLKERAIGNVSFIFREEFIVQRANVHWRARMALSRIKKDIHLLPVLLKLNDAELHSIKMQILSDIFRPIGSDNLMYSLLLNFDLAVSPVLSEEDAEDGLFRLINEKLLTLLGNRFISDMLAPRGGFPEHVTQQKKARILASLCQRLNQSKDPRAGALLETLFNSGLISLEDLPLSVKNRVLTIKHMTNFLTKPDIILQSFDETTEADIYEFRALTLISLVPLLVQPGQISLAIKFVTLLNKHALENSERSALAMQKRTELVFGETLPLASELFLTAAKEIRTQLAELFQLIGHGSIPHLQDILIRTNDMWRCKQAAEILSAMGGKAMASLVSAIDGHMLNSVSLTVILKILYETPECIPLDQAVQVCINHLDNSDADVRREALTGLLRLDPVGRFAIFTPRLKDPDLRVRKIAVSGLGKAGDPRAFALLTALVNAAEKSDWYDEQALGGTCIEAIGSLMKSCPQEHDRICSWFASQVGILSAKGSWMKLLPVASAPAISLAVSLTETLGKLPAGDASGLLAQLAQHQAPAVAQRAGELLGKIATA